MSVGLVPTGTDVCITKSICCLNREVKWTVKTALLSALEAMMSCDFMISNVRHLDRAEGKVCIARAQPAAILGPKYSFLGLE